MFGGRGGEIEGWMVMVMVVVEGGRSWSGEVDVD